MSAGRLRAGARRGFGSRPRGPAVRRTVALAGALLGLAGCGSSHHPVGNTIEARSLTIYTSLPLQGASAPGAQAVLDGEQLALEQEGGRIGRYTIVLRALDDASPQRGGWDPGQTELNARHAAQDPSTIAYVGDFNSGASAVSIPILNRMGIPQVSPASTAVGLTSAGPGASPGEPDKYYPTGQRTFVRLMPDDAVEARVQLRLQRGLGCSSTYVLYDDDDFDGQDLAAAFQQQLPKGHRLAGVQAFEPHASDYRSLALAVAHTGADCVMISALPASRAVLLTKELAAALPRARLFATCLLRQPSYTRPARGGIPAALESRVLMTGPVAGLGTAAHAFATAYGARFGDPDPDAAYGYEAMRILLAAIRRSTDQGRAPVRRSQVLAALFGTRVHDSAVGPFVVTRRGSTTLSHYGVYRLTPAGPRLWYTADPGPLQGS